MSKRVLVTGGNRGIGKAIAIQLAKDGFEIFINYKSDIANANQTLGAIIEGGGPGSTAFF